MKLVAENINEAIKHLSPKSENELKAASKNWNPIDKYLHKIKLTPIEQTKFNKTRIPDLINGIKELNLKVKFEWNEDDEYHFVIQKFPYIKIYYENLNVFFMFDEEKKFGISLLVDGEPWTKVISQLQNYIDYYGK